MRGQEEAGKKKNKDKSLESAENGHTSFVLGEALVA